MSSPTHPVPVGLSLKRAFDDLKVRPKLMVLHNLFFLLLGTTVYLAVLPPFERELQFSWSREGQVVRQLFIEGRFANPTEPSRDAYHYLEGSASLLSLPAPAKEQLDAGRTSLYESPERPGTLYRKLSEERYAKVELPAELFGGRIARARFILFGVLAVVYLAAIGVLELIIMPYYVYKPLTLTLDADRATMQGDREHELVPESELPEDEIGEIMRSRNAMVQELRRQEDRLAEALAHIEDVNLDLQRKNQMLERARQSLETTDRLVSLGLMSASVAHELNTPLAVLHGSIEKMKETLTDAASQDRLGRMLRVTQRLRTISESLLDFARVRRTALEPVGVRHLLEESWQLVSIDEKSNEVEFVNLTGAGEKIIGNEDRLVQVFVNLLRNSLQAIPKGGRIRARSTTVREEGREMVRLIVEDNGPGIPPEVLPNIFDAFVSSRLDARGTGLGLTVAEGIIHQHRGTIAARNGPDGGASIEVSLPAATEAVSAV